MKPLMLALLAEAGLRLGNLRVCGELLILAETTSETQSCESLTYR
jgi:hypothetical protein